MLRCVLVLALVAGSLAIYEDCCSAKDRANVHAAWDFIWSGDHTDTHKRIAIGKKVFAALFDKHPEAKQLFKRVNVDDMDSPEFTAHCLRVVNGVDVALNLLDEPDTLYMQLKHLNGQHQKRTGIIPEHFQFMAEAFQTILPQVSGIFNPEAWEHCFSRITQVISEGLTA